MLSPNLRARVNEVAANLQGTCKDLNDEATEAERENTEFLVALDEQVINCTGCGWWCEPEEMDENPATGEIECGDCRDEE